MMFFLYFLLFFFYHGLGVTAGYHRLGSHRSAQCNKVLYYLLLWGGYTALMGGIISWCGLHRYHHIFVDSEKDPHSPSQKGFFQAFQGWIWKGNNPDCDHLVPWLKNDKILRFFGSGPLPSRPLLNISICILWRVLIYYTLGAEAALASAVAGVLIFLAPQLINTICHMPKMGYRNYKTPDLSTNVHWLNFLTFGENYHNNHHRFPSRPFQGEFNRGEWDTTYFFMLICKRLGLMRF